MKKNILKITTILCTLAIVPGVLLAKTETGPGYVDKSASKTTKYGSTVNRSAQRSAEYGNDSARDATTANGKYINTSVFSGGGDKSVYIGVIGSKGDVGVEVENDNGQKVASKSIYTEKGELDKSIYNDNGSNYKTKTLSVDKGTISKTESSDGTVTTTLSKRYGEPNVTKTTSDGVTTIETSSGETKTYSTPR